METEPEGYMGIKEGNTMTSTRPANPIRVVNVPNGRTSSTRDAYMERREKAKEFAKSERGKYAIAQALYMALEQAKEEDNPMVSGEVSKAVVNDIEHLFTHLYAPLLWGGKRWYGDH